MKTMKTVFYLEYYLGDLESLSMSIDYRMTSGKEAFLAMTQPTKSWSSVACPARKALDSLDSLALDQPLLAISIRKNDVFLLVIDLPEIDIDLLRGDL